MGFIASSVHQPTNRFLKACWGLSLIGVTWLNGSPAAVATRSPQGAIATIAHVAQTTATMAGGVGVRLATDPDTNNMRVVTVQPDSAAAQGGLLPGDVVVAVDGQSIAGLSSAEVADRLRGAPGTTVELTIQRDDKETMVTLTRQLLPRIGFEFEGVPTLNSVQINRFEFTGECPGQLGGTLPARFTSNQTPPAPGRRVRIRNITIGLVGSPAPYTDRAYSGSQASEPTIIAFGREHDSQYLNVLEGWNKFEYEIRQGDRIIDFGTFRAQINRNFEQRDRAATCKVETYCVSNANTPLAQCDQIGQREQCACPAGDVFTRNERLLPPGERPVSQTTATRAPAAPPTAPSATPTPQDLVIVNQLNHAVNYRLNGTDYVLEPRGRRTHPGDRFTIEYDYSYAPDYQRRAYTLQPGTINTFEQQFGTIELVRP